MRILLVEDNEDSRDMLNRRLSRRGYEVLTAVNGAEGLEVAASQLPDLILMDLDLPEIDGWEATRRLKASPETGHIPVVALTSHTMGDDRTRAIEAGCDEFATKPVNFPHLLGIIERLAGKLEE